MVTRTIVEKPSGRGELYEGERFLRIVEYQLTISQKQLDVGAMGSAGSSIGGISAIEGYLRDLDGQEGFFDLLGKELILRLNDGRRWDCVIEDIVGKVRDKGRGLYKPT